MELQPELILLRQLRCLMTREFSCSALLYIWDFVFAGITDSGRDIMKHNDFEDSFWDDLGIVN